MASKVFIDTNVLLAVHGGFDLTGELQDHYSQYQPTIVEGTMRELENARRTGKGAQKAAARLALSLIERQDLNIVSESVHHVDTALLEAAGPGDLIATLDRELQERAKAQGTPVLTIRKRRLLRPA